MSRIDEISRKIKFYSKYNQNKITTNKFAETNTKLEKNHKSNKFLEGVVEDYKEF